MTWPRSPPQRPNGGAGPAGRNSVFMLAAMLAGRRPAGWAPRLSTGLGGAVRKLRAILAPSETIGPSIAGVGRSPVFSSYSGVALASGPSRPRWVPVGLSSDRPYEGGGAGARRLRIYTMQSRPGSQSTDSLRTEEINLGCQARCASAFSGLCGRAISDCMGRVCVRRTGSGSTKD